MNNIDDYLKPRKDPTENQQILFLAEVNRKCPLCGNFLLKEKKDRVNKLYQIAHIYPNSPTQEEVKELYGLERLGEDSESFENKIALCKDCHGYYDDHKTKEEYSKFLNIKKELLNKIRLEKQLSSQEIEDELEIIIKKLGEITGEEVPLKHTALRISKKIEKTNVLLKSKIEQYVSLYFYTIRNLFNDLEYKDNFNIVASQSHTAFLLAEKGKLSKSQIFSDLVSWIESKIPGYSKESYEAIISFFVQNCEVFNEITE